MRWMPQAPREWARGDGGEDGDEDGGEGGEEEGRDGEEVDPDSNAGLALRWRLCHKRALQRAQGGGGEGRGGERRRRYLAS